MECSLHWPDKHAALWAARWAALRTARRAGRRLGRRAGRRAALRRNRLSSAPFSPVSPLAKRSHTLALRLFSRRSIRAYSAAKSRRRIPLHSPALPRVLRLWRGDRFSCCCTVTSAIVLTLLLQE